MKDYQIKITKQAAKDIDLLRPKNKQKLKDILFEVLAKNPFVGKKLLGDLKGNYSYGLTIRDRIIYSVDALEQIIFIKRARTHYGE